MSLKDHVAQMGYKDKLPQLSCPPSLLEEAREGGDPSDLCEGTLGGLEGIIVMTGGS